MSLPSLPQKSEPCDPSKVQPLTPDASPSRIHSPHQESSTFLRTSRCSESLITSPSGPLRTPGVCSVVMATNREQQVGHMTGFPPAVYPFAFNSMRSHTPFDLLANSSLFGRFGADLPKEMAALCKFISFLCVFCVSFLSLIHFNYIRRPYLHFSNIMQFGPEL